MKYYVLLHSCYGSQLEACDARQVFGPWSDLDIAQNKQDEMWEHVESLGLEMAVTILEVEEDKFADIPAKPTEEDLLPYDQ